jgi:DNA polymerase III epsilon subunit family exonuclease
MHPGSRLPAAAAAAVLALTVPAARLRARAGEIAAATRLADVTFVAFDTETTGLSPRSNRIVEIGAVRFRNGTVLESRSWLINPGIPIPDAASAIHGITDEMVADRPSFSAVFPQFVRFAGEAVWMAHNAGFDVRFLSAELLRTGTAAPGNTVVDTLKLSRTWFPDAGSYRLGRLLEHLGLAHGGLHRALADAHAAASIVSAGAARMPPDATVGDLLAIAGGGRRIEVQPVSRNAQSPRSEDSAKSANSPAGPPEKLSRIPDTACETLSPER